MFFLNLIKKIIPDFYSKDSKLAQSALLLASVLVVLLPMELLYSFIYYSYGHIDGAKYILGKTIFDFLILILFTRGINFKLLVNMLGVSFLGILTYFAFVNGGLSFPSVSWFIIIPVLTTILLNVRSGLYWFIIVQLVITTNFFMKINGVDLGNVEQLNIESPVMEQVMYWFHAFGIIMIIYIFTVIMYSSRESAEKELLSEKQSVENKIKEAVQEMEDQNKELEGQKKEIQETVELAEKAKVDLENEKDKIHEYQDYLKDKINLLLNEMSKFSKGDLTISLDIEKDDEVGSLFAGFNHSVININQMFRSVSEMINRTNSLCMQLSDLAEKVTSASDDQKFKSDSVAEATENLVEIADRNSETVSNTNESATKNKESAGSGSIIVAKTVNKINSISVEMATTSDKINQLKESSDEIKNIISVIDEIAEQTNLLALNASIEAARAGEHGRGFAVVADEIRKLSEKTTNATGEISNMIKGIQDDTGAVIFSIKGVINGINEGIELSEKAGESLKAIQESSDELLNQITELERSNQEQNSNIREISSSMSEINDLSIQNTEVVTTISDSIAKLDEITLDLKDMSDTFKLS